MIVFTYKPFANNIDPYSEIDSDYHKTLHNTSKYEKIDFKNGIFDESHIIEDTSISNENGDKKDWQLDTVFLWDCTSYEAGNLGLDGMTINKLQIRRRKADELTFETIHEIDYEGDNFNFNYRDNTVESLEDYVYAVRPVAGSSQDPIYGDHTTAEVYCEFESVWILDGEQQYQLKYNLEVGNYETNIPSEVIETMGSKYPIVASDGNLKYRRGSLNCMLLSEDTAYGSGGINKKEEKKLRQSIMEFLTSRKPKVFKDGSGEIMLMSIVSSPSLSPRNNLGQLVYDLDIEFVEVGEAKVEGLVENGILVI